ncbi:MAG: maleylpyruvate isomerase N-terminal domain-containing protein [Anaerolineae bacterium]|nr:maleylpyruvate isomerase N-terminal domain-containing protein [Anaerolineae bacterium]
MHAVDILQVGHNAIMRALDGLPDDDWFTPDVCGHWSVKDIIAHLASTERALVEAFLVARGQTMGSYLAGLTRDTQEFNEIRVGMRVGYSPQDVLAEYLEAHAEVMELAAALPPSLYINTGFMPSYGMKYDLEDFAAHTMGHKMEHAAQITLFRERLDKGDAFS